MMVCVSSVCLWTKFGQLKTEIQTTGMINCVALAVLNVYCLRGAVPPGARFDPFGPVPPGGSRADPRSGRFAG